MPERRRRPRLTTLERPPEARTASAPPGAACPARSAASGRGTLASRLALGVVLTAVLGGCAEQWTYAKADVSETQRERDEAECRRDAKVPRVLRPFVLEGSKVVSYPLMDIDLPVYNRCVEAKGYAVLGN